MIKMADLKTCLEHVGLERVSTYIQSGNVLFSSRETDEQKLAKVVEAAIEKTFKLSVRVMVLSQRRINGIIANLPVGWGSQPQWRYYFLFVFPPYDPRQAVKEMGDPRPDIELLVAGDSVVYQANDMRQYGKTTVSKLIGKPVYKQITIRNHNTTAKIKALLDAML